MKTILINLVFKNQFLVAILFIFFGWFLLQIIDIVFAFFAAYIIMAALLPVVLFLEKKHIPKIIAISLPYIVVVLLLFFILFPLISFTSNQFSQAIMHIPAYTKTVNDIFHLKLNTSQINTFLTSHAEIISRNVFALTTSFFNVLLLIFAVIVLSLYMIFYREKFLDLMVYVFPKKQKKNIATTAVLVEEKLGAWLRGQLILSGVIGILTFFALLILHIEFALPLAFFAGIMELLPTIGPLISAIPAIFIALNQSLSTAGLVILAYIIIQTIEGNFLVPQIMNKAVDVNPIAIIAAVLIGSKLFGIAGALFAVPFVSLLFTVYKEMIKMQI